MNSKKLNKENQKQTKCQCPGNRDSCQAHEGHHETKDTRTCFKVHTHKHTHTRRFSTPSSSGPADRLSPLTSRGETGAGIVLIACRERESLARAITQIPRDRSLQGAPQTPPPPSLYHRPTPTPCACQTNRAPYHASSARVGGVSCKGKRKLSTHFRERGGGGGHS